MASGMRVLSRVEKFVAEAGIRYFFLETHGILHSNPQPKYGVYAPVYCQGTNVAAFGRDVNRQNLSGAPMKAIPDTPLIVNSTGILALIWKWII